MAIRKKLRYKKKAMAGERLYLAKVLATDTSRRGRPEIETKCSKYYMENNYAYKKTYCLSNVYINFCLYWKCIFLISTVCAEI